MPHGKKNPENFSCQLIKSNPIQNHVRANNWKKKKKSSFNIQNQTCCYYNLYSPQLVFAGRATCCRTLNKLHRTKDSALLKWLPNFFFFKPQERTLNSPRTCILQYFVPRSPINLDFGKILNKNTLILWLKEEIKASWKCFFFFPKHMFFRSVYPIYKSLFLFCTWLNYGINSGHLVTINIMQDTGEEHSCVSWVCFLCRCRSSYLKWKEKQ